MSIHFDPRAMDAKRQRAEELAKRELTKPAKRLHPTDFAVTCAAVAAAAAVLTLWIGA